MDRRSRALAQDEATGARTDGGAAVPAAARPAPGPEASAAPATGTSSTGTSSTGTSSAAAGRRVVLLWAAVGALLGGLQMLVVHRSLVDDAYITMTYARNLAYHLHWGLLPDVTSNTATSPFFVMVLGLVTAVVRHSVIALGLVVMGSFAVLGACLAATARRLGQSAVVAPIGLVLLLVSPLLLSATGLETHLLLALVSALLWAGVTRRPLVFGLVAAALVLTRMDAGVYVAVLALGLPGVRRRLHVAVLAALVVTVPWYLFSWLQLGSAIPNTLLLKQDHTWGPWTFANGLHLYYLSYPVPALLSAAVPALGALMALLLLVLSARRVIAWSASGPWLLLALAGGGVFLAYSRLVVPPFHWYYGSPLGALTLVAAGGTGLLLHAARQRATTAGASLERGRPGALATGAAGTATAGALGALALLSAVAVVAHGTPWRQAAITTNWATPAQYLAVGDALDEQLPDGDRLQSPGEIGTLAFACDCIVDQFADPTALRPLIEERIADAGSLSRPLLELNYRHADLQERPVQTQGALVYRSGPPAAGAAPLTWAVDSTWRGPGTLAVETPATSR